LILESVFCIKNTPKFLINSKIDYDLAKRKAGQKLNDFFAESETEFDFVIIEPFTIRKEFGWIFFYTSKIHFETKNEDYALAGNAPFIVDNLTGKITATGTADEIEFYVHLCRKYRNDLNKFKQSAFESRVYPKCIWEILFWRIINPIQYKNEERKWLNMK